MHKLRTRVIYFLAFLLSLQIAMPAYINSSFIESRFIFNNLVGILYALSSVITILSFFYLTKILKKIGNTRLTLLLFILNSLCLSFLAFSTNSLIILLSFILFLVLGTLIFFSLDIFLEKQTKNDNTGNIRGKYMTLMDTAWLISPLLTGLILTNGDYWKIYFISFLITVPFLIFLAWGFFDFRDPIYEKINFSQTFLKLKKNKNIFNIFIVRIYLNLFYSWMVIYIPIYLHKHIGLDWTQIGTIFSIMLLPFILFQIPVGKIADKFIGEKEILNTGITILSFSTILLSIIGVENMWIWAFVLFLTRTGASLIAITSESYFFKQIKAGDADIISFFRMTNPIAYFIGPILASFLLTFINFQFIFLILGIICLTALKFGLSIKDTK